MAGTRVVRPATAFAGGLGPKRRPRIKIDTHLVFIRSLPSLVRASPDDPVEAAHIRMQSIGHGKRETGKSEKPSDFWVVPLASGVHRAQHTMSERSFWMAHGIDPLVVAALLWVHSGDEEAACDVIRAAQQHRFRPEF